ncbi:MAG: hypothetical protein ABFD61_02160, partial [Chloroherpetonaceae bacterium]
MIKKYDFAGKAKLRKVRSKMKKVHLNQVQSTQGKQAKRFYGIDWNRVGLCSSPEVAVLMKYSSF